MARIGRGRSARLTPLAQLTGDPRDVSGFGRRAAALARAARAGAAVVPTWVLPAAVFRHAVRNALPPAHDPASLLRVIHRPVGVQRAARARERLLQLSLSEDVAAQLRSFWLGVGVDASWGLLVSAAPTCADDTICTSAGLDVVVRGVKTEQGLEHAVRFVWSTAMHEDTLRTLRAHRIRDLGLAVLLQLMDETVAHGAVVCHTPSTRQSGPAPSASDHDQAAASAAARSIAVTHCALGLAAPVIDGSSARDVASLTSDCRVVEHRIAVKDQALVVKAHGAEFVDTDPQESARFALSPTAVSGVCALAEALGRESDAPLLAQYAVDRGGAVRATEIRHVAGLGYPAGGEANTVWSRVGLSSELPGVTTPLTGSVLEELLPGGLATALSALGCRLPRGVPILRRVRGRPYWNLSALLPALAQAPAIDPSALANFAGGEALGPLRQQLRALGRPSSVLGLPLAFARLAALQGRLDAQVRRAERDLDPYRRWFTEMDLAILPDDALVTTFAELRRRLERTARLMFTCTLTAVACQCALQQLLARSAPTSAARDAQALTSGLGELTSAEPGIALGHVIAIAHKDAQARAALLARPVATPSGLPSSPTRRALGQFLEAYRDRGVGEAELMSPRWADDPRLVLAMVTAGLHHDTMDPDAAQSYVRVQSDAVLADLEARLPLVESALVRSLASRAKRMIPLRERVRTSLVRSLSMLRVLALDAGRRLRRLDATLLPGSVFFTTLDELVSALVHRRGDLGPTTRLRQASFERDAGHVDPPESFCGIPPAIALPRSVGRGWQGVACCAGLVVGSARVLKPRGLGAERLRPGEILVTRGPDLGLSPLFWMAAGVVTELGGPLASGCIVAREYGVPMVAGVAGATTAIRDGERLRLDGDRGVVERLDR
jgi:phosphohistidine swiveling domain-containing protein